MSLFAPLFAPAVCPCLPIGLGHRAPNDFSTATTEACLGALIALLMAYGGASPVLAFRISGKRPYVKPITPVKDP